MVRQEERCFEYRGVRIDDANIDDITDIVSVGSTKKGYICFNDVSNIMLAISDPGMLKSVNESYISASDGMPLVWFGRLVGGKRIDRVTGFDCLSHFLEEDNGLRHFLLGDTDETIETVINKARSRNTNLQVKGYSPPFKDAFNDDDNEIIIKQINDFDADVVWVSFGGGKQEKWMHENYLKINKGLMMGVGAAFRFYIGALTVPPKIFQKMGLQWFFRMLDNPNPNYWIKTHLPYRLKFLLYMPVEVFKGWAIGRPR